MPRSFLARIAQLLAGANTKPTGLSRAESQKGSFLAVLLPPRLSHFPSISRVSHWENGLDNRRCVYGI